MREVIKIIDREAEALAAVRSKPIINLQHTVKRVLQSIQQQKQLYPDDWIEDLNNPYYTPRGYFIDNLAV